METWFGEGGQTALWTVAGGLSGRYPGGGVEFPVPCAVWTSERIGVVDMFRDLSLWTVYVLGTAPGSKGHAQSAANVARIKEQEKEVSRNLNLVDLKESNGFVL